MPVMSAPNWMNSHYLKSEMCHISYIYQKFPVDRLRRNWNELSTCAFNQQCLLLLIQEFQCMQPTYLQTVLSQWCEWSTTMYWSVIIYTVNHKKWQYIRDHNFGKSRSIFITKNFTHV